MKKKDSKIVLPHEKPVWECDKTIREIKEQNQKNGLWAEEEIEALEEKLKELKQKVYSQLTPWERVTICRHPQRPHSLDYIKNIASEFEEIAGDRTFADDLAIVAALAKIDGQNFVIIGQEKGKDTDSRLKRNFGMPHPEGYRKALRAMQLAEKFKLPVVTLIDTPGAYHGFTAEERGQGWAIAKNLFEMARLKTQIIIAVIGEGCSGGALAMGVGDKIAMLQHAYYSVISPEGCASILWKDAKKNSIAAEKLKMQSEDLLYLKVIDHIIEEPEGGAHHQPAMVYEGLKQFILTSYNELKEYEISDLIDARYEKFRAMGMFEIVHS